eukprot:14048298-Alexandrium_andersonii.AAC.2
MASSHCLRARRPPLAVCVCVGRGAARARSASSAPWRSTSPRLSSLRARLRRQGLRACARVP